MVTADLRSRIDRHIQKHRDQLIEWVAAAVRIPSVTGRESAMQEYVARLYASMGLEVIRHQPVREQVADHPAFVDSGIPFSNRQNIIGILRGRTDAPSLTLHGHVDVVSPEPVDQWNHDPWGAEIVGNRMYGRGAGDMKAGHMANAFALKTLLDLGLKPRGTVMLMSTVEEEAGGGGGTLACMVSGFLTDGFVTTEPHSLNLTISHAGVLYFRVKVQGRTAHAGLAHTGVNAIVKMQPIVQALWELDQNRGQMVRFALYEEGSGRSCHLNLGTLRAGDWPSTVAGWAVLECRIGFVPGETSGEIQALVERTVREVAAGDPWLAEHPPQVEWFGWKAEPWYQDPDHAYVRAFKSAAEAVLGREVRIQGRAAANDARFTDYFGRAGVAFGPICGNMHGIDEWVDLDSVVDTARVLAYHIAEWCGLE
ncbi:ArgE/DapE family deacylase [Caldinitratiruptor microaerophilus]|uniref:Acetylornithine deacetylase n=1 Tax=Caldinitratiruptor microaerophilus TaxID=671077 RepID=A0AA35G5U2_9FIRM|nr:ArgE/DapE family deacylase [Caldinitratiruptor microaerophilus]BDG60121.1 acetylornithine deacetylase [Caldinitratiruptor microaerophilus]